MLFCVQQTRLRCVHVCVHVSSSPLCLCVWDSRRNVYISSSPLLESESRGSTVCTCVCVCAHGFFVTGMWWWWCRPQKIKVDQGYVCLCLWVCVRLLQGMKDSLVSTEINIACVQASKVRLVWKGQWEHIYIHLLVRHLGCACVNVISTKGYNPVLTPKPRTSLSRWVR